nr:AI-2E family transporter [Leptotrichiaceae bacterium]
AILLGVFCGIFNVIPYIGPYLGALPAIIVGLGQDPKLVIGIIIVVLVVQQIDGNILTPKVQGKGLNLHPLSILITIAIFGNLFGIIGMVLSIPVLAMLKTTFVFIKNKMQNAALTN